MQFLVRLGGKNLCVTRAYGLPLTPIESRNGDINNKTINSDEVLQVTFIHSFIHSSSASLRWGPREDL